MNFGSYEWVKLKKKYFNELIDVFKATKQFSKSEFLRNFSIISANMKS